jgi:preprotein translocase subunit SecB
MEQKTQPGIAVAQVFLERMAFSHRGDFLALPLDTKPEVGDVAIGVSVGEGTDGESGLVRIEVRTDPARNPLYNVELAMVALVRRLPGKGSLSIRDFVLSAASVSLLYPFVREAFAAVTLRGRFGPVWLNLLNPQAIAAGFKAIAAEAFSAPQASPGRSSAPAARKAATGRPRRTRARS